MFSLPQLTNLLDFPLTGREVSDWRREDGPQLAEGHTYRLGDGDLEGDVLGQVIGSIRISIVMSNE